jgi:single-strand DNA-binding protein
MFAVLNQSGSILRLTSLQTAGTKINIMNTLRNKVQLIGRLGKDPEIVTFDDGNKLAKFSMATDDSYKNKDGQKIERAYWHDVVVRGGLVNVVENYVTKGQEIAIEGKLTNRSWEDKEGKTRYTTEIMCNELLLLGSKA